MAVATLNRSDDVQPTRARPYFGGREHVGVTGQLPGIQHRTTAIRLAKGSADTIAAGQVSNTVWTQWMED